MKAEFPAEYAAIYAPRPFNEGGERIKALRKKHGMTLLELKRATGISIAELSRIETGVVEATQEQIDRIGYAFQRGK